MGNQKTNDQLILEGWLAINEPLRKSIEATGAEMGDFDIDESTRENVYAYDIVNTKQDKLYSWMGDTLAEAYRRHGALLRAREIWQNLMNKMVLGNPTMGDLLEAGNEIKELAEDFDLTDAEVQG